MAPPTKRQTEHLRALQAKTGMSDADLYKMMGWTITGPFGSRLDQSRITKTSVSVAINRLKTMGSAT